MRTERRRRRKRRTFPTVACVLLLALSAAGIFLLLRARSDLSALPAMPEESPEAAEPAPTPEPEETPPPEIYRAVFLDADGETSVTVTEGEPLALPEGAARPGYTFFGWVDESGAAVPEGDVFLGGDTRFEAAYRITLGGETHSAYLPLDGSGQARPNELMPRSDAAIMFSRLISAEPETADNEEDAEEEPFFSDVTEKDDCFEACTALRALGLLEGESFRPSDPLTRGELLEMLSRFYPAAEGSYSFSDLSGEEACYPAFCLAIERAWLPYEEGVAAGADAELTRLDVAVLMNRVLQRHADPSVLTADLSALSDLPENEEEQLTILEAMIPHVATEDESGERWAEADIPTLPIPGFTTRDLEVDAWLKNILDTTLKDDMTQKEKLRVLYVYVRDSFRYRKGEVYDAPDPSILTAETRKMMVEEGGNCYTHASLLCELYRAIGVDARVYGGTVSDADNPHAWVEATIDRRTYVFDAELEKTKIRFQQPYFDFFMRTYYDVKGWDYQRSFVLE